MSLSVCGGNVLSEFLSTARKLFVKCRDLSQYDVSPSNYKRMHMQYLFCGGVATADERLCLLRYGA